MLPRRPVGRLLTRRRFWRRRSKPPCIASMLGVVSTDSPAASRRAHDHPLQDGKHRIADDWGQALGDRACAGADRTPPARAKRRGAEDTAIDTPFRGVNNHLFPFSLVVPSRRYHMPFIRKLGVTLVAAVLVTAYGCSKPE